jgi:hypothetical protein
MRCDVVADTVEVPSCGNAVIGKCGRVVNNERLRGLADSPGVCQTLSVSFNDAFEQFAWIQGPCA